MTYEFKFLEIEGGGDLNRWCGVRVRPRQQTGRRDEIGVFGIEDVRDREGAVGDRRWKRWRRSREFFFSCRRFLLERKRRGDFLFLFFFFTELKVYSY